MTKSERLAILRALRRLLSADWRKQDEADSVAEEDAMFAREELAELRDEIAALEAGTFEAGHVPMRDWKWYGYPKHFIGADRCKFRLGTQVGKYIVSTVGDYVVDGKKTQIGLDRFYETKVFWAVPCPPDEFFEVPCNCMMIDPSELECVGANDHVTAERNHMTMCRWYALAEYQAKTPDASNP